MNAYINATIPFSSHDAFIIGEDGTFVDVGRKHTILNQAVDSVTDLKDATVLPGFHDSHLHVLGIGWQARMVNAEAHESIASFLEAIAARDEPFIMGRGFHENRIIESRMLKRSDLDSVAPDTPVVVYRACGHMCIANSAAIELATKTHGPLEESESIDLANGLFKEDGMKAVLSLQETPDQKTLESMILTAQSDLLKNGVTSVGSDDFHVTDAPYERVIDAFKSLDEQGKLKLNVFEQVNLPTLDLLDDFLSKGYAHKQFGRFTMGPLKLLADGSLGARSAYMKTPYADADTRGILLFDAPTLQTFFERIKPYGMDFAVHGIGDGTIEAILDAKEAVGGGKRDSIIHAQLADHAQIARMHALGVGAQTQPIFINSDRPIISDRLGARAEETYLFESMRTSGVVTTLSTDAPIEATNPLNNLYVAITRKSIDHPDLPPFLPGEAMALKDAIEAYTTTPAYYTYETDKVGKIARKQRADFIVVEGFDANDPQSLLNTTIKQTYIHGECVYRRDSHA